MAVEWPNGSRLAYWQSSGLMRAVPKLALNARCTPLECSSQCGYAAKGHLSLATVSGHRLAVAVDIDWGCLTRGTCEGLATERPASRRHWWHELCATHFPVEVMCGL